MDSRHQIDAPEVEVPHALGGSCCWCGEVDAEPLRSDYGICARCGTVIYTEPYDPSDFAAGGSSDFYSDHYWQVHVPKTLGLPGLDQRARSDLPERAVHHLEQILRYSGPGSKILELGCGAGTLTYLLQQAGFRATGLELAPAAIAEAESRFGIEVVQGPIEALAAADSETSYDVIVAIDVLEHLTDPLGTLEECLRRLTKKGLLFLQTPRYRGEGADWSMLIPREHLFLFTRRSVERLLGAAGFRSVGVEPGLFPHDMWIVASPAAELAPRTEMLAGTSPIALALIDARKDALRAEAEREAIEADRRAKAENIEALDRELESVRSDQVSKEELLGRQHQELIGVRADQDSKQELIEQLSEELGQIRRDQLAKGDRANRLNCELGRVERDREAKARLIERLEGELAALRSDHAARGKLIERTGSELEQVRADQQAKEAVILRLDANAQQQRRELELLQEALRDQDEKVRFAVAQVEQRTAELASARRELATLRADHFYRLGMTLRSWLGKLRR
ncbi:MAG: methyltransferase domain-containing protein [Acidobacteriota bacterium]